MFPKIADSLISNISYLDETLSRILQEYMDLVLSTQVILVLSVQVRIN